MEKITAFSLVVLILVSSVGAYAQTNIPAAEKDFVNALDSFVRKTTESFPDIPGMAVVVVKDDQPVFLKAYGLADREAGANADTDTLFYIASSTKSFTALAAAMLDKEGRIRFSDPVANYAAGLSLKNEVPEKVSVRDLLVHTSGLENNALVFRMAYTGDSDAKNMARVFAAGTTYAEAKYGKYDYDNLGYNVYGVLLQNHLKIKWQDLLQERIFNPLGMRHTTAYISQAGARRWTVAAPYQFDPAAGKQVRSPLAKRDNNLQSAGGLFASISDIGKWLNVNINGGRLNGKQVFPAELIRAAHTGYTRTTRDAPPFTGDGEYGLGWQIGKYKNEKVIYHHGGFPGYRSHISFMPERNLGVAVLVNDGIIGGRAGHMIATYAYDRWVGGAEVEADYAKQLQELADAYGKGMQQQLSAADDRAKRRSQLTRPLTAYTGKYVNELFGTIGVTVKGTDLSLKMGNIDVVSTAFTSPETIRVEMVPGTGEPIKFNLMPDGRIASLEYSRAVFTKVDR